MWEQFDVGTVFNITISKRFQCKFKASLIRKIIILEELFD